MSGAFPISNSKFSTMGIKSIQNTIISKSAPWPSIAIVVSPAEWTPLTAKGEQ